MYCIEDIVGSSSKMHEAKSLVESELFGYAGGTFTGGRRDGKAGLQPGFEQRRHIGQTGQEILVGTEIHPHRYNH
ncbi:sigma 54-interacting transcriptional regulator [uncultured Megasphaera sp.]|uniref:sigma 54-interacting transcriptional regulator n=1 Tax=uncultured Megasphaera sp. TaxID=165188 RepID=UPI002805DC58|nr:sigma 54-interacting transcriptional regulator [uncultured Megasphaera sp.]